MEISCSPTYRVQTLNPKPYHNDGAQVFCKPICLTGQMQIRLRSYHQGTTPNSGEACSNLNDLTYLHEIILVTLSCLHLSEDAQKHATKLD